MTEAYSVFLHKTAIFDKMVRMLGKFIILIDLESINYHLQSIAEWLCAQPLQFPWHHHQHNNEYLHLITVKP